jgi:hypothetical protein
MLAPWGILQGADAGGTKADLQAGPPALTWRASTPDLGSLAEPPSVLLWKPTMSILPMLTLVDSGQALSWACRRGQGEGAIIAAVWAGIRRPAAGGFLY